MAITRSDKYLWDTWWQSLCCTHSDFFFPHLILTITLGNSSHSGVRHESTGLGRYLISTVLITEAGRHLSSDPKAQFCHICNPSVGEVGTGGSPRFTHWPVMPLGYH